MVDRKKRANICIDCKKACGGCSWSAVDPKTGKIRFEPVPGWTAEAVLLKLGAYGSRKYERLTDTYHITACPEFEGDAYEIHHDCKQLSPAESAWFLDNVNQILREWAND
jgi:hypothetical protein